MGRGGEGPFFHNQGLAADMHLLRGLMEADMEACTCACACAYASMECRYGCAVGQLSCLLLALDLSGLWSSSVPL